VNAYRQSSDLSVKVEYWEDFTSAQGNKTSQMVMIRDTCAFVDAICLGEDSVVSA
jgi:hypothetical protein